MRIRTIKPEFWMHEGLCGLSEFSRLLAIALLNWADDEGYFMAHPALLKGSLFPFEEDSTKIPRSIQDLSRVGWIETATDTQGRPVGRIINFAKHQRVDKPKRSVISPLWVFQEDSKTDLGNVVDESKEEWKGMEQGKERNGSQREREESQIHPIDEIKRRINTLRPEWEQMPHFTASENYALQGAAMALESLDDAGWQTLKEYLAYRPRGDEKLWQVRSRAKFLEAPVDTLTAANEWKTKNGKRPTYTQESIWK